MTSPTVSRLKRIITALDAAIDVFRRSASKPTVDDIEAETKLTSYRSELSKLVPNESKIPWKE
jgi:hypothetical protein